VRLLYDAAYRVTNPLSLEQDSFRSAQWVPLLVLIVAWAGIFWFLTLLNHLTLRTNGFDLSVFDYALWSTTHGPSLGFIPFYHLRLSSFHVMPTLWLLWPAYLMLPSPMLLIGAQVLAIALAAAHLARQTSARVPRLAAFALLAAFLFSRRTYSAVTSVFYVECFEPLLVFGLVWATTQKRRRVFWAILAITLGCKEDMAIYTGAYGLLLMMDEETIGSAVFACRRRRADGAVRSPRERQRSLTRATARAARPLI
jgi:uncharacterized membrane protein